MSQYAVAIQDISNSNCTNESGSSGNLYQSVDEGATPDDADYIQATGNADVVFKLSTISNPGVLIGHWIRLRGSRSARLGTATASVEIWQGDPSTGVFIASQTLTLTNDIEQADYELDSSFESNLISDYSDLYARLIFSGATGNTRKCTWFVFEAPDAPVSQHSEFFQFF